MSPDPSRDTIAEAPSSSLESTTASSPVQKPDPIDDNEKANKNDSDETNDAMAKKSASLKKLEMLCAKLDQAKNRNLPWKTS